MFFPYPSAHSIPATWQGCGATAGAGAPSHPVLGSPWAGGTLCQQGISSDSADLGQTCSWIFIKGLSGEVGNANLN